MHGPPPVLAPPDNREHGNNRRVEVRRHLPVARADHHIPAADELTIPLTVALESDSITVPVVPVGFDDEPFPDDEVDASDPGNQHLTLRTDAVSTQGEPHEGLDPGFGRRIVELQHPPPTCSRFQNLANTRGAQDPPIHERVHGDHEVPDVSANEG